MKHLQKYLRQLGRQVKTGESLVTYCDVEQWPEGILLEIIQQGVLVKTQNASETKCPGCAENCYVEPDVITLPDGRCCVQVLCRDQGCRIELDPKLLDQYEIIPKRLQELGCWPREPSDEYIGFAEAGSILDKGKSAVSKMADQGRFKDNGLTGQHRRLLLSSVLLVKHELQEIEEKKDLIELRADVMSVPDRH